jgi:hypothetical protein
MRNKECNTQVIKEEHRTSEGYEYSYLLTERSSRRISSYRLPLYSIRIRMKGEDVSSEKEVKDAFSDLGKAVTFFDELVDNLATPIDLPYILEDMV